MKITTSSIKTGICGRGWVMVSRRATMMVKTPPGSGASLMEKTRGNRTDHTSQGVLALVNRNRYSAMTLLFLPFTSHFFCTHGSEDNEMTVESVSILECASVNIRVRDKHL